MTKIYDKINDKIYDKINYKINDKINNSFIIRIIIFSYYIL